MAHMRQALVGGLAFYVVAALLIRLASGSWHVALHGGFYIALVFTIWLEARLSGSYPPRSKD